ncbi:MAG: hypothetical protein OXR84_04740 [Magnetovibrio sp.]|nr:hypothetical protein [Magnetovibrio sp.]
MLYGRSTAEAEAHSRIVEVNGRDYLLNGYVGASPVRGYYKEGNEVNDNGEPQGFLVHQPPGAITLPHFHETNQFQVVVGGGGRFGKQASPPLSVQYANAHTPYGPITGGDDGITYFTLRARWDPGAKYMPASRDRLIKGNQRQRLVGGIPVTAPAAMAARTRAEVETVMDPEPDGLAAWLHRLPPDFEITAADPAGGGGQYIVVAGGEMVLDGAAYPERSCLFLTADEAALHAHAGAGGLELLVMQFPRP